jgi:tetratricopeptide (TPR) repeat protein
VHQELAVSHQALGEVAPAVARLRRVLELAPERTPVAIRLAILLLESGDAAGALVQLERARRDLPQDVELAAMTGRALLLLDDPAGAVAAFETAARLGAVDPWVRNEWGNALARLGRYREAEAQLRAVLESDGSNAQALYQLGLTLEVQGRRDEAKRLYEQAMALGANPLVAARLDALSG